MRLTLLRVLGIFVFFFFISAFSTNLTKIKANTHLHKGLQAPADKTKGSVNFTDSNGLKQGVWKTYHRGKVIKEDRYKDGKLHGKCHAYLADGTRSTIPYKNGLRHGYYFSTQDKYAKMVTYYSNDSAEWSAFPWEYEHYMIPVKGFILGLDSVEVNIPYQSGKLLYKGLVVKESPHGTKPVGIHTAYYENGEIKSIINYNTDSIAAYNETGRLMISESIMDWLADTLKFDRSR